MVTKERLQDLAEDGKPADYDDPKPAKPAPKPKAKKAKAKKTTKASK